MVMFHSNPRSRPRASEPSRCQMLAFNVTNGAQAAPYVPVAEPTGNGNGNARRKAAALMDEEDDEEELNNQLRDVELAERQIELEGKKPEFRKKLWRLRKKMA
ncbi:hypothetical protein B0A55_05029 [Friedmanniomyces simplex]|uniref:Uncharacterized protein n=1 Tax=Friedmanniomyces simplex TaxID=329884 RepID=A0A4U0XF87_9PEZI|nr:hypothetical protein B0A55_05029 [Friedmanniomyces simplex]